MVCFGFVAVLAVGFWGFLKHSVQIHQRKCQIIFFPLERTEILNYSLKCSSSKKQSCEVIVKVVVRSPSPLSFLFLLCWIS